MLRVIVAFLSLVPLFSLNFLSVLKRKVFFSQQKGFFFVNYWVQIVPVSIQIISCTPRWADYMSVFLKNLLSQYSLLIRVLASTLCFLNPPGSYTQHFTEYRGFSRHWGPFLL